VGLLAALAISAASATQVAAASGHAKNGSPDPPGGAPPEVEKVAPRTGATGGATEVTITGQKFGSPCSLSFTGPTCQNMIVYFGNEPGLVFSGSSSRIQVFSPPHASGAVPVTVVTPNGSSASQGENQDAEFTYAGPAPTQTPGALPVVKSVEPGRGPAVGFNTVVVRGEHLTPEDSLCVQCAGDVVHFGASAVAVALGSEHELVVTAPPHARGTVDVTVTTNPGGASATGDTDQYTFE
jgi:hypothetical protein